jgi:hypothetical protein
MPGCGLRGKPKAGFSSQPTALGNRWRDFHIPAVPTYRRMEKWKSKGRIPTFPHSVSLIQNQTRKETQPRLLTSSFRLISKLENARPARKGPQNNASGTVYFRSLNSIAQVTSQLKTPSIETRRKPGLVPRNL